MLFFITGTNGVGKTACLPALKRVLPEFAVHDFADLRVPPEPDARLRQETSELWVRTYLERHKPKAALSSSQARPSLARFSLLLRLVRSMHSTPVCSTVTTSHASIVCAPAAPMDLVCRSFAGRHSFGYML